MSNVALISASIRKMETPARTRTQSNGAANHVAVAAASRASASSSSATLPRLQPGKRSAMRLPSTRAVSMIFWASSERYLETTFIRPPHISFPCVSTLTDQKFRNAALIGICFRLDFAHERQSIQMVRCQLNRRSRGFAGMISSARHRGLASRHFTPASRRLQPMEGGAHKRGHCDVPDHTIARLRSGLDSLGSAWRRLMGSDGL